jgi:hypothetical protein
MAWKRQAALAIAAALLFPPLLVEAQTIGFLALAEGNVSLIRGATDYAASEGIRVHEGDILKTEAKSQAHIQLQDGTLLNLGPQTRLLLLNVPPARGAAGEAEIAMLSGWAKLTLKKSASPKAYRIHTPVAQLASEDATVVLRAGANFAEAFVETGSIKFAEMRGKELAANRRNVKGGEFVAYKSAQAIAIAPRPPPEFIKAMPRHFQDPLPVLADKLKERKIEPKREHDVTYDEVEDWLKASLVVRKGFVKRFQPRARDPEFRAALVKNLRGHPEWDRTLFPEKYEEKENKEAAGTVKPRQ